MYVTVSEVSCGVDQLYGFCDYEPGTSMDELLRVVSRTLWERRYLDHESTRSLSAGMFVFSDIVGENGDLFGQWLIANSPGTVVRLTAKNPNSGNQIATYLWKPDLKGLAKLPGWAAGRKQARESVPAYERRTFY